MQKNYESRLSHHLHKCTVLVFSCLLSIPSSYIEAAKEEGLPFYRHFLCCRTPQHGCQFRDYCRSSCDVEIIPGYVLWRIEGATEVVKTTLQQVGVKKIVHLTAHYQLCWYR